MKKLSEQKFIRTIALILSTLQLTAPVSAADNIQMINSQPVAVVSIDQAQTAVKSSTDAPSNNQTDFEAGAVSAAAQTINLPEGWTHALGNPKFSWTAETIQVPYLSYGRYGTTTTMVNGTRIKLRELLDDGSFVDRFSSPAQVGSYPNYSNVTVSGDGKYFIFSDNVAANESKLGAKIFTSIYALQSQEAKLLYSTYWELQSVSIDDALNARLTQNRYEYQDNAPNHTAQIVRTVQFNLNDFSSAQNTVDAYYGNNKPSIAPQDFEEVSPGTLKLTMYVGGTTLSNDVVYEVFYLTKKTDGTKSVSKIEHYNSEHKLLDVVFPVPAGWTRATSNSVYAYKITNTNALNPMAGNEVLVVRDLSTGVETEVYNKPASQEDIWDQPAVSSDGKQVVLTTRAAGGAFKVYVKDLTTTSAATEFVVSNEAWVSKAPNAIQITDKEIRIEMVSSDMTVSKGTYVIDRMSLKGELKWINVLPAGYVVAKSNSDFAFSEIYERVGSMTKYTLRLLNMKTGSLQDIATRMEPYGGFTKNYDVSPDGLTVIYEMRGAISPSPAPYTVHLQRIGNPAEKIVVSQGSLANGGVALQTVQFEKGFAKLIYVNGYKQFVNLKTLKPEPFILPEGYQSFPSNSNFSYQISFTNKQNPMAGNEVLNVYDAITGKEYEVYNKPAAEEDIWDKPDVTADGKHLVFLTRVSPSGVNLYIQELKEGGTQRVISLGNGLLKGPGTISFSGSEIVVQMAVPALRYRVNLTTGKVQFTVTQAAAWTVPKSNAKYKMAVVHPSGYSPVLYVWDLATNVVSIVGIDSSKVDFYDLSPDGETVIYGEKPVANKTMGSTWLVGLNAQSQKTSDSGPVQYRFTDDGKVVIQTAQGNPISVYDLKTLKRESASPSGQSYISSPDGAYLIKDEMGTGRVHLKKEGIENWKEVLFDASESPILSVMVTNGRLYYLAGSDNPTIKYIDLDAINFKLPNPSILPASVKKVWTVAGVSITDRNSVEFSQEEGTVSFQDKTGKIQVFLLGSPSAWTVVASNKNFAYRLTTDESGQSAALKVLNLKTGQIHTVATLDNGGMNGEVFDLSKLAVSPDGKTVVYEKGNRAGNFTVVSSIETPEESSRELVGSLTKAPVFSGAQVTLSLLPSGESKPVLVSLNTKTLMTTREQTIAGYFQTLLSRAPTWDELGGYGDLSLSFAAIRAEILVSAERLDRIHEIVSREFGFEVKPETVLYFAKQGRTYAQIKADAAALFKATPKQFLSNW